MIHADADEPLFDSGYTEEQLDAIFDSLLKGHDPDIHERFWLALEIGIVDGDVLPPDNGRETVMLQTPREELDRRIAAVRAAMARGATLQEAVELLETKGRAAG